MDQDKKKSNLKSKLALGGTAAGALFTALTSGCGATTVANIGGVYSVLPETDESSSKFEANFSVTGNGKHPVILEAHGTGISDGEGSRYLLNIDLSDAMIFIPTEKDTVRYTETRGDTLFQIRDIISDAYFRAGPVVRFNMDTSGDIANPEGHMPYTAGGFFLSYRDSDLFEKEGVSISAEISGVANFQDIADAELRGRLHFLSMNPGSNYGVGIDGDVRMGLRAEDNPYMGNKTWATINPFLSIKAGDAYVTIGPQFSAYNSDISTSVRLNLEALLKSAKDNTIRKVDFAENEKGVLVPEDPNGYVRDGNLLISEKAYLDNHKLGKTEIEGIKFYGPKDATEPINELNYGN